LHRQMQALFLYAVPKNGGCTTRVFRRVRWLRLRGATAQKSLLSRKEGCGS
jgi:hypothetical protein